jgi:ABC-type maltose transport system permease subunit
MWWVLDGSIVGLAASSLMMVYWFSRLRLAMAEKGLKYTSTLLALPWIMVLFTSIYVLMRELTVIQIGGTVDTTLLYTLAILDLVVLATVGTGMILDTVKRRPNLQHNRL